METKADYLKSMVELAAECMDAATEITPSTEDQRQTMLMLTAVVTLLGAIVNNGDTQ